jgi:hypothetical protein
MTVNDYIAVIGFIGFAFFWFFFAAIYYLYKYHTTNDLYENLKDRYHSVFREWRKDTEELSILDKTHKNLLTKYEQACQNLKVCDKNYITAQAEVKKLKNKSNDSEALKAFISELTNDGSAMVEIRHIDSRDVYFHRR